MQECWYESTCPQLLQEYHLESIVLDVATVRKGSLSFKYLKPDASASFSKSFSKQTTHVGVPCDAVSLLIVHSFWQILQEIKQPTLTLRTKVKFNLARFELILSFKHS